MSRIFATSIDHLDVASATVTAAPLTMCAWVKMNSLGSAGNVFNVGTSGVNTNRFALLKNASDQVSGTVDDGAATSVTTTATIADTTSWHLIAVTFGSTTNRTAYLDGVPGNTNVVSRVPSGINAMRIGCTFIATQAHDGLIAHVALWNVALTPYEHTLLLGQTPDLIRPASLVEYWPITGASPELSFGTSPHNMVVTNTVVSTDNPLFPATAWLAA